MKLLLITDCHYGEDSNFAWHGGEHYINVFGSQFEYCFAQLKQIIASRQYDLVANLGDCIADHSYLHGLTDESASIDRKHFQQFLACWQGIATPVFHLLGNHDGELISRADFKAMLGRETYFSCDLAGFHHIILDPVWGRVPYYIDDQQWAWLEADLEATSLPTIVYIHTPCDEHDLTDNYYHKINPARYFIANRASLRSIFERSNRVRLVLQGHSHFYMNHNINGIKYLTIPSFMENDTTGKPTGEFVSLTIEPDNKTAISIRRERVATTPNALQKDTFNELITV